MVPLNISSLILVILMVWAHLATPTIISREKGQFIPGKGCGNSNNPIRYLEKIPESTKGFECSFIPKWTGFITFEPEDGQ